MFIGYACAGGYRLPQRRLVLGMLFLMVLIMYLDRLAIGVAAPRMQAELGLTPGQWGWVIGAFTLAYAAFEMPSGALGDRNGQRTVLTRIVVWWSAFTALTGVVTGLGQLLGVRFYLVRGRRGRFRMRRGWWRGGFRRGSGRGRVPPFGLRLRWAG